MEVVDPSVISKKSLLPQVYVTRQIDAYLMEGLDFGERYCVPSEQDTIGKSVLCEGGHTNLYAFERDFVIVIYRDYLKEDYGYLDFYVRYRHTDTSSPEAFAEFLRRTFDEYQFAFSGTEEEVRKFGNAPKIYTLTERIRNWFKSFRNVAEQKTN